MTPVGGRAAALIQLLPSPASNFMGCCEYWRPCSRCAPRCPSEVSELSDAAPPPPPPGVSEEGRSGSAAGASGGRVGERLHAASLPMRCVLAQMRFTSYLLMSKLVTAFRPRNLIAAMSYASAASSCVPAV